MSATATQRLVPIRPSPAKGLTSSNSKAITIGITTASSPSTLTPPRTGIKRKLEEPSPENVKCKRKINFGVNYVVSPQPAAVARRNARERNRVKQVNNGFATLRQHIPGASKAKKISKVDTLKQAVDYIRSLQELLEDHDRIMTQGNINANIPQNHSVNVSAFDYNTNTLQTVTASSLPQNKVSFTNYYYGENVSPICASVYPLSSSVHSPTCSDGATSSPSPSYLSDTSSQISCHETQQQTINPEEVFIAPNFNFTDTYGGTFDLYSTTTVPNLEEDEVLEAIASWQKSK
ncbi:UNVERIFIED_CONTAM: hypothetical protein RMT77_004166 [Armadillidium vulgare]|nr:Achaete-scute-like protein 1a [Armadillidium vulgare]